MTSDTISSPCKLALIVEDDADCAGLIKMILEIENWRVECVKSGSEALRVLTDRITGEVGSFDPDVMVLDLRLPDMNGSEIVERLQNQGGKIPPTVIITAGSPIALNDAISRVGGVGLRKPFSFEELYSAITDALAMARTPSAQNHGPG